MAELQSFENIQIKNKPPKDLIVDMSILEYLYVVSLNDILDDDILTKLIIDNGIYQQAICEANDVKTMTIVYNNEEYIFSDNKPPNVPDTIALVKGETLFRKPIGIKVINE